MALTDKYRTLIDLAGQLGINLDVQDEGSVLRLSGTVPSEAHKNRLFEEYNRLDPDMRSGDLVLTLDVSGEGQGGGEEVYTVERGDTLSEIGQRFGVPWREIFEANRDQLDNPDRIQPGQQLRIPRK